MPFRFYSFKEHKVYRDIVSFKTERNKWHKFPLDKTVEILIHNVMYHGLVVWEVRIFEGPPASVFLVTRQDKLFILHQLFPDLPMEQIRGKLPWMIIRDNNEDPQITGISTGIAMAVLESHHKMCN